MLFHLRCTVSHLPYRTFTRFSTNLALNLRLARTSKQTHCRARGPAVEKPQLLTIRVDGESGDTSYDQQKTQRRGVHRAHPDSFFQREFQRGKRFSTSLKRFRGLGRSTKRIHQVQKLLTDTDTFDERTENPGSWSNGTARLLPTMQEGIDRS